MHGVEEMIIESGGDVNTHHFGFNDEDIECIFNKVFKEKIGNDNK